jgi:hypothetical protein
MMKVLLKLILNILLRPQKDSDLVLENLALRQQLVILKRPKKRPQIRTKNVFSAFCFVVSGATGRSH